MSTAELDSTPQLPVWRWRLLTAALIVGAAAFRLAYLAHHCPLDLAPDEAHYWDWSRHLDWSYYSKGPLVAWLIRLGCLAAGGLSRALMGNEMLAVRLPAVVCGSLLLAALYVLTVQVYRREGLAFAVVGLALTTPLVAAGSTLMTIDAPYTCCWAWALVLGHHALFRRAAWAWPAAGLLVGLGILAKYTMVLWLPALALFLLTTPGYRRLLLRPGPWLLAGVAGLCCLPILFWNAGHDWVSVRHVLGLAGVSGRPRGLDWFGPLAFLGVQFALLLGFWFLAWVASLFAHAPWREARPELRYLWWMSIVMFGVFLVFGLKTGGGEPNWPVTAYISGMVLAAGWLRERFVGSVGWRRRLAIWGTAAGCVLGVVLMLLLYGGEVVQPLLARLAGPPTPAHPMPLRRFDPTCRLRGWQTALAAEVDRQRQRLRAEGIEPLLAASSWGLPGEVAFYCQGNPVVYCLGAALGDRHSQYDFWRPNPISDAGPFVGRTFLFIGDLTPALQLAFTKVETPRPVIYRENGQPVAEWTVIVCRGFRGFPSVPAEGRRSY
jgi:4-amino-4-deoxy-L-arabinose transferase-like glycosyltransferase